MAKYYAFRESDARNLAYVAKNPAGQADIGRVAQPGTLYTTKFVKLTAAAPAASTDQLTKTTAQLYGWDPGNDPSTLAIDDLGTQDVWNPHDVEIPSGTLCIIGKFPNGWVIIAPVNWCPSEIPTT
jgi:hypothetical protein